MPKVLGHDYDAATERLEVRLHHPVAGRVLRIYRNFAPEMYEAWRLEDFGARVFFLSFVDEYDEEYLLHG